jgi:hypothetical protein
VGYAQGIHVKANDFPGIVNPKCPGATAQGRWDIDGVENAPNVEEAVIDAARELIITHNGARVVDFFRTGAGGSRVIDGRESAPRIQESVRASVCQSVVTHDLAAMVNI